MGYRTVDEWGSFEFQNADVEAIRKERGHWYLELGYVTILPDNSCNRDIRKMGTNELTLQLQHVQVDEILEEGFKLYDADGNFTKSVDDRVLLSEEYDAWMEDMVGGAVYQILHKDTGDEALPYQYEIYLDANDRTYLAKVSAKHDVETWERFMNRHSE